MVIIVLLLFIQKSGLQQRRRGEEPHGMGMTAANIIDAIITKQINNENNADSSNSNNSASSPMQHTSVIVPPKNQK